MSLLKGAATIQPMEANTPLRATFAPEPVDRVITIPLVRAAAAGQRPLHATDEDLMDEIADLGSDDDDSDARNDVISLSFMSRVKDVLHTFIDRSLLDTPDSLHLIQELLTFASATRLGALPTAALPSFSLINNMPPEGLDFEKQSPQVAVPPSSSSSGSHIVSPFPPSLLCRKC